MRPRLRWGGRGRIPAPQETRVITLFDAATDREIGNITEAQLQFMIDQLEEESEDDRDYYINGATLDLFESAGADPSLMGVLRKALGDREEMDLRWERT
jgi:processive 1,2-diacylglycerol beta-glucosyltransferase